MSSISRRRNGLMALSVIGGSCLSEVLGPSISRQDACRPLLPELSSRYKLPRQRFSPSTLSGRSVGRHDGRRIPYFVGIDNFSPELVFPHGYVSGSPLGISTDTWLNAS